MTSTAGLDADVPADVAADLEYIVFHWGSAYEPGYADGQFTARRRDGRGGVLTDPARDGLLGKIRADYIALPVPKDRSLRYRDIKQADLDRARDAVAAWRAEHPDGTAEEMLEALSAGFRPGFGPVLRGELFQADQRRQRETTGDPR